MKLSHLQLLVDLDELRSYTAAARRRHISQPGAWKQMQSLEQELGLQLVEKVGIDLTLTWAGKALVEQARQLVEAADEFEKHAHRLRSGETRYVSIACRPIDITRALAPILGLIKERGPSMTVNLFQPTETLAGSSDILFNKLLTGQVDLVSAPRRPTQTASTGQPLYSFRVVVVLPDEHPLRHLRNVTMSDIASEPFLVLPRGIFSRDEFERLCLEEGVARRIVHEVPTIGGLIALGNAGIGTPVMADDFDVPPVKPFPILTDQMRREVGTDIWLHWRVKATPDRATSNPSLPGTTNPAVEEFAEMAGRWSSETGALRGQVGRA